jgi:phosphoglycerate kinase
MPIRTINDLADIRGKFVLLRDDLNVQIKDGKITDAFRIEQSMPTIKRLAAAGARIAICSHLGRPLAGADPQFSLRPVADYMKIPLVPDCLDKSFMAGMKDGDVVLLENTRFHSGEEANDPDFAARLAAGFDIFVNDAFAASHRAHASTAGVAKLLPSFAGLLLSSEIAELARVMENPARPFAAIIGGAKLDTKIKVLESLASRCDALIIGGGLGTVFALASGKYDWTDELYKPEYKPIIEKILAAAAMRGCAIIIPSDKGVGAEFAPGAARTDKLLSEISAGDIIMDDGPKSAAAYKDAINGARTLIWNGTFGKAEWGPVWGRSTFDIARHVAERTRAGKLVSIIGGGDAVAAINATGAKNDMTYASTGGGAFLEFLEGRKLPGIEALSSAPQC